MKKYSIFIIILLLFIPFSFADLGAFEGLTCQENIAGLNADIERCENVAPGTPTSNNSCASIIDNNLFNTSERWSTLTGLDIYDVAPAGTFRPEMIISYSEPIDFDVVSVYIESPHAGAMPVNWTVEIFKNGVWTPILDIENYNATVQLCSTQNRYCWEFNESYQNVEKIKFNISQRNFEVAPLSNNVITHEFVICESESVLCDFPTIFCDNFNYQSSYYDKNGWYLLDGIQVDENFAPINNEMNLSDSREITAQIKTEPFEINYGISDIKYVSGSVFAPVFSTEFDLKMHSGGFLHTIRDIHGRIPLALSLNTTDNGSMSWVYDTYTGQFPICIDCFSVDEYRTFKVVLFYTQNEYMTFNSTIARNYFRFYENDILLGEGEFFNNDSVNAEQFEFTKDSDDVMVIDNFYVMVGTDREVDTSELFFTDVNRDDVYNTSVGAGTGDLSTNFESIWDQFGLRSTSSRLIMGLFLMVILALAIMGISMANGMHVPMTAIVFIEFIFMIFLAILQLIPSWVVILLGILGAGIGGISFYVVARGG